MIAVSIAHVQLNNFISHALISYDKKIYNFWLIDWDVLFIDDDVCRAMRLL